MSLKSFTLSGLSLHFFKLFFTNSLSLHHRLNPFPKLPKLPSPSPNKENGILVLPSQTLIFDVEGWLLRSSSTFPYFIIVALEASSFFRALLLLLIYPLVCCMKSEASLKLMVMICFFGVRKETIRVSRAVLSKYFMDCVGEEGFKVVIKGRRRVGVSMMPKVMVECFLKEYLEVDLVIGRELKEFCGFYTGFMKRKQEEMMMEINGEEVLGFGCYGDEDHHQNVFSYCKEVHRVTEAEKSSWHPLPRENYPKSLIFHDGRIAFLPMPAATLAMFIWLPFGAILSIIRHIIGMFFPPHISFLIGAFAGMVYRDIKPQKVEFQSKPTYNKSTCGRLYICNHRTLLDPLYISASLNKQVTAVVYSLSPVTEFLSPIKTARLTRNKDEDRKKMEKLLKQGDLVVCPEGTTCREPFLLRFSPLFVELADEITPVALKTEVTMFYGTTACGFKWLDSLYFLMNPWPKYVVQFLEEISVVSDSGERLNPCEMANHVQREIGRCLGFKCTTLTRKDKYQMLAGNDGVVQKKHNTRFM